MKEEVKNLTALEIEQGGKICKAEHKANRINSALKSIRKHLYSLKTDVEFKDLCELEIINRLSSSIKDLGYLIDDEQAASATAGIERTYYEIIKEESND